MQNFLSESKRILKNSGIFVIALPVLRTEESRRKLGILKFTWTSEHYTVNFIKNQLSENGFSIIEEIEIGDRVYSPLADYYIKNRDYLKTAIKQKYPDFIEKILHQSIQKMKKASDEKIIGYVIFKCQLKNY